MRIKPGGLVTNGLADLENGNGSGETRTVEASPDALTEFRAVLGVDLQRSGAGLSGRSTLDSADRDHRFTELDRLIADEELYRPKGIAPARKSDSGP